MILDLTAREREVLELAHLTADETGRELRLAKKTVDAYRAKAVEHLGASSWIDAVRIYTDWKATREGAKAERARIAAVERYETVRKDKRRVVVPQSESLELVP